MGSCTLSAWLLAVALLLNPSESATAIDGRSPPTVAERASAADKQLEEAAAAKGTKGSPRNQPLPLPVQNAFEKLMNILKNPSIIVEPLSTAANQALSDVIRGVSRRCINETQFMLKNLQSPWAQAMMDSFGKQPSGVMTGITRWLGDFDECVGAKSDSSYAISISGRYCTAPIPITYNGKQELVYTAGCVPSGCDGDDLKNFIVQVLGLLGQIQNGTMEGFVVNCQDTNRTLDAGAITATVVVSLFVLLLVVGTMYDVAADAYVCLLKDFCGETVRSTAAEADLSSVQLHTMTNSIGSNMAQSQSQLQLVPSENLKEDNNHTNNDGLQYMSESKSDGLHCGTFVRRLPDSKTCSQQPIEKASTSKCPRVQERGVAGKILSSFSLYTNGKKLLSAAKGDPTLSSLNGVRFFSMCWVLLGHTYFFSFGLLSGYKTFLSEVATRISFQAVSNASFAVDSFFLLSSLLVSYLLLKELEKRKGSLSAKEWILIYVHRYIRLTGVYAVVLLIYVGFTFYLYDGPQWPTNGKFDGTCSKYWWTNLLYVNNFFEEKPGVSCMGWTWYLANDMQMFLIAPLFIYVIYKLPYVGISITALLTFGSVVSAAIIAMDNNMTMSFAAQSDPVFSGNFVSKVYIKPWNRFQAYGVGIILGYILHKVKGNFKIPKVLGLMGWIIAAGCCSSALYGPYDISVGDRAFNHSVAEASIYTALSRLAWTVGVAWVIFACGSGNGGWINTLLSWKPFTPLARLCYCTYLVHPIIMMIMQQGGRDTIHFDHITMVVRFLGQAAISMALAFVTSLAFEAPLLGIEKILFKAETKK